MRILYHHRTQGEEPESIHILSIVQALEKMGHEVRIVGPSMKTMKAAGSNSKVLSSIKKYLPGLLFEVLQILYNIISYQKLRKAIDEFKPDLIYERYALYCFAGILVSRHKNVPLVLEVNTPYAYAWAQYYKIYFPRLAKKIERWVLESAGKMITVTAAQRTFLNENHITRTDIAVCHNAIDPDAFSPAIEPSQVDGLRDASIVVGFVGTMNRWQGIPTFKEIISHTTEANPNIQFLMVGDGECRKELEGYLIETGRADRAIFVGRKAHAEIAALVKRMDIAVLPNSNAYGSPMKMFEYMAMGKAVIGPAVGPVNEIVEDGVTGFIIEPGDATAMTEKILLLANNEKLRDDMSAKAKQYILDNHTWANNANVIIDLYNDIVKAR
ncbi:MAG: glycosyltransferase family 4 protein [Gammaproteobacteria bacterium]|nr:glycosyltransferase family 4 protein [Gammaproteobacteria bacterium]